MNPMKSGVPSVFLVASVCGLMLAGAVTSADAPLISRWRTEDVRIDGVMREWSQLTFVSKEVSTSVMNDGQDLYLLVATSDPGVHLQIRRAGLLVYLDPRGGKARAFGVRVPPLGARLAPGSGPVGDGDPPVLSYFDILGPGEAMRRVQVDEPTGIDLRIGSHEGTLFLELKVPFATGDGHPYAPGINLAKGEVGLGIVTPEPLREARPGGRSGRGGVSFGGGRMGGGGPGMPSPAKGREVKIWTKIVLAKAR